MKRIRMGTLAICLLAAAGAAGAQVKDYKIDPNHSEANFAIKHLAISTVHGSFHGVNGVVRFDPKNPETMSVEATIDVTTVSTGINARDNHLKSADFFEVAKFPSMTFKSTGVVKAGDHYDLKGELTLHGVTKPVVLHMEPPSKAMPGNPGKDGKVLVHHGFTAMTTINRKEFGLLWDGSPTSTGDKVLSDDVKVEIDIDAAG